jgi:predicted esterase
VRPAASDEGIESRQRQRHVRGDGVVLEVPIVRREQIQLEVLRTLVADVLAVDHHAEPELPLRDDELVLEAGHVGCESLRAMVESVAARYPVVRSRILLTGMSDGATYALLCGLGGDTPFTHLAPACGVLHPMLLASGDLMRAQNRPIYLIHGAMDWMFPVQTAHLAREALTAAGAKLVYREIEDLSHTYPRDENPKILDWLRRPEE